MAAPQVLILQHLAAAKRKEKHRNVAELLRRQSSEWLLWWNKLKGNSVVNVELKPFSFSKEVHGNA